MIKIKKNTVLCWTQFVDRFKIVLMSIKSHVIQELRNLCSGWIPACLGLCLTASRTAAGSNTCQVRPAISTSDCSTDGLVPASRGT